MRQIVEVKGYEQKQSKNGKQYYRFDTSAGWVSVFEKDIIDVLIATTTTPSKKIDVEVIESGNFKNIRKIYTSPPQSSQAKPLSQAKPTSPSSRETAMYVAYAKDLFIKLYDNTTFGEKQAVRETFAFCVELIKKAKQDLA